MWKITNTANDRSKAELHRTASKFTYEPSIGGVRLRLGETIEMDDEHFEENRSLLEGWQAKGMVDFERVGGEPAKAEGEQKPEEKTEDPPQGEAPPADAPPADAPPEEGEAPVETVSDESAETPAAEPAAEKAETSEGQPKKSKKRLY
jgi:hypothetical protein